MKKKESNFDLKERFKNLSWKRLDDFEKYFISILLIFIIFGIISYLLGLSFLSDIINNQQERISKAFSVPITKDKTFSIDASDILFTFIIFIAVIIALILTLVKLRFKRKK